MKCEILMIRNKEIDVSLIPENTVDQLVLQELEEKGVEMMPLSGDGGLIETCVVTLSRKK